MHLLTSREYPVVGYQTMAEFTGFERLFRAINGIFWLHMSYATSHRLICWRQDSSHADFAEPCAYPLLHRCECRSLGRDAYILR